MPAEQNRALTRRYYEEVVNEGKLDLVEEVIAPDYVGHEPGEEIQGPAGFKRFLGMMRAAFPDLNATVEAEIAEGDKVVARYTARGSHQGELMGVEPTGKQVEVSGIEINRISGGKIVEQWNMYDAMGMMQQLGVIPEPEQAQGA
jgi:steroid delta-isomerase-like uncharacterized protein